MPKALVVHANLDRQYNQLHLSFDLVITDDSGIIQQEFLHQIVAFDGIASKLNALIESRAMSLANGARIRINAADVIMQRFA